MNDNTNDSDVFLIVGGTSGYIKVLNLTQRTVSQVHLSSSTHYQILSGHCGVVRCIKSVQRNSYLILSV